MDWSTKILYFSYDTSILDSCKGVATAIIGYGNLISKMSFSSNLARGVAYEGISLPLATFFKPTYAYQQQRTTAMEKEYINCFILDFDAEFQRLGPHNCIAFIAELMVGAIVGCVTVPKGRCPAVRKLATNMGCCFAWTRACVRWAKKAHILLLSRKHGSGYLRDWERVGRRMPYFSLVMAN